MVGGTNVPLTAFTFSQDKGIDFGDLVYMASEKDGNLKKAVFV